MIEKSISIEELIQILPESVSFLMKRGIKCLACGELIWGTLESAAKEKGFSTQEVESFVKELNLLYKTVIHIS